MKVILLFIVITGYVCIYVHRIPIISSMIQKDAVHVVFVGLFLTLQFCVYTHNTAG